MADVDMLDITKIGSKSNHGIVIFSFNEGTIEYNNNGLLKILGIVAPLEISHAENLLGFIVADDVAFVRHKLSQLRQQDVLSNVQFRVSSLDTNKYVSADAYVMREENKVLVIIRDITKAKQHENYVISYGGKKDTLLEMLAHNLSGPLNLSQKIIELLEKSYKKEKPATDLSTHITFIKEATKQCIHTITEFLKDEHLLSEKIFVKRNRFDVVELTNDIIDQYNQSYPGRKMKLDTKYDQLFMSGDNVKLMQIINNLLSNAVKFTPANCAIDIKLLEDDNQILLIVEDDGIGIPDHLKPLIFQKYTPAGRTGLNGEKSIGLGLSIVKKLVELMKGEINFESKVDKGTKFLVYLPKE